MSEKKLLNEIMIVHSSFGGRIFRNNVGTGWAGKFKGRFANGDVVIGNASPLNSGLCVGSSDLIGWSPVVVSDAMVGKTLGIFTAAECKIGKLKTTKIQENFLNAVDNSGGLSFVCRSIEEYNEKMGEFYELHSHG